MPNLAKPVDPASVAQAIITALDERASSGKNTVPPDGYVDRAEWGTRARGGFNRLDLDGDGRLSPDELATAVAALPEAAQRKLAGQAVGCTAALARGRHASLTLHVLAGCALVLLLGAVIVTTMNLEAAPGGGFWGMVAGLPLLTTGWVVGASWLAVRRRRERTGLVEALAEAIEAIGFGLGGEALATAVLSLLTSLPREATGGTSMPAHIGVDFNVNPNHWPEGRAWQHGPLARKIEGLATPGRRRIGRLVDEMTATSLNYFNLSAIGGIICACGIGFIMLSLHITYGGQTKSGRPIAPNPALGQLVFTGACGGLALGLLLLVIAWIGVGRLRRRFAADVVGVLEGRG